MSRNRGRYQGLRSAYTLIELVVASATATILMGGLSGSIYIGSLAFNEGDLQSAKAVAAGNTADHIMDEMSYATRFYERTPHAVTFAVPDRDGDGSEETFRYAWSGVVDDPLTKELNGSAPSVVLVSVKSLDFTYMTRMLIAPPPVVVFVPKVVFEEFTETKMASDVTEIPLDIPAGTEEDDLLISVVTTEHDNTGDLVASMPGWTQVALLDADGDATIGVWWKLAANSELSTHVFSWAGGMSGNAYGWMMRFTGHDTTSPINASATADSASASSSSPPSPAVMTTVDNAMILRLGGFERDDIVVDDPGLPGHTPVTMDSGDDKVSGGAGYVAQTSAGDSGTSNFSLTVARDYATVTIAIAPATE